MGLFKIHAGGEGGLVGCLSICAAFHLLSDPAFCVSWLLGINTFVGLIGESTMTIKRVRGRNEPSLKLSIG